MNHTSSHVLDGKKHIEEINIDKLVYLINSSDSISIFFGDYENTYCKKCLSYLNSIAEKNEIEKVYYFDFKKLYKGSKSTLKNKIIFQYLKKIERIIEQDNYNAGLFDNESLNYLFTNDKYYSLLNIPAMFVFQENHVLGSFYMKQHDTYKKEEIVNNYNSLFSLL